MSLADDVRAVRSSVTLIASDHVAAVRIGGAQAHELLDRVSPQQLFVRGGQMLHTLLLADDATPVADVYLCCGDDDYTVLAEGLDGPALAAYLAAHATGLDAQITDLTPTHAMLSLDGPYAWELLTNLTSPHVIGLPYLAFYDEGRFTCFRAGKTGEFGYDLLVERARVDEIRALIEAAGASVGLRTITLPAIETCALEAGFFNIRRDVRPGLTPIELQLQWRVATIRTFPGSAALDARRATVTSRVACLASAAELVDDAPVLLDNEQVGRILHAAHSPTRDEFLALALLDLPISHAGISGFVSNGAAARTLSSPTINNRSLYVDPQRHSWATRDTDVFPPILRPAWS